MGPIGVHCSHGKVNNHGSKKKKKAKNANAAHKHWIQTPPYYCTLYINKHEIYTLFIKVHIYLKRKMNNEFGQNILMSVR